MEYDVRKEDAVDPTKPVPTAEEPSSRPWVRPVLLGIALVAMLVAANMLGLGTRLGDLRTWILELGAWGPVVFIALYVVGADAVTKGLAEGRVPWLLVAVVVAVAFGLAMIVRRVRRALQSRESDQFAEQGAPHGHAA